MPDVNNEDAHGALNEGAKNITEDDVQTVLDKQSQIENKLKGPLKRFAKDLRLLLEIIRSYVSGEYREVPWLSIAAIVAALLYILNPIDLIPDVIPCIGLLDDALVVAACLAMVESDLHDYDAWKQKKENRSS